MVRGWLKWRGLILIGVWLCLVLGQSIAQEEHSEGDFQLEHVLGRGAVQDISISPDGHTLAVGSARGVWLYSFPEMDDLDFLPQEGGVGMVSWAPDGERLALGKSGAQVTIWEPGSGKLDHIEQFAVRNIVWSPDGNYLALGGWNHLYIYSADSLEPSITLPIGTHIVGIVWSPDGRHISTALVDGTFQIWEASQGERTAHWAIRDPAYGVTDDLRWSPDGQRVATAGGSMDITIWESGSGQLAHQLGRNSSVLSLAWSPDGRLIASGGVDAAGAIYIWDARTGESLPILYHRSSIHFLEWLPDGKQLISADEDGMLRLWDVERGGQLGYWALEGDGRALWSPDGTRLATFTSASTIQVWDLKSGSPLGRQQHDDSIHHTSWSPDGRYIASSTLDGIIHMWDAENGETVNIREFHSHFLGLLEWSPDGTRLLTSGVGDQQPHLWDAANGDLLQVLPFSVFTAKWSPDGSLIAASTYDDRIFLLDAESLDFEHELVHGEWVQSLRWSPDGQRLVSVADHSLRVWDIQRRELLAEIVDEEQRFRIAGWSPMGQYLVFSFDHSLKIWDVASGGILSELPQGFEVGWFHSVHWSWSPDERQLAYVLLGDGLNVGDLRIWDLQLEEDIAVLKGHSGRMAGVSWSAEGSHLFTTGYDGTVHIWRTPESAPLVSGTDEVVWLQGGVHGLVISPEEAFWAQERVLGRGVIGKMTLSPDGNTLAVAGSRGIWLYSLPDLELVTHIDPGTWVWQAVWSPDGKRLASLDAGGAVYLVGEEGGYTRFAGSSARAVWLWDAASGERLFALEDSASTDGVIWSPTGGMLAGDAAEGVIRLWDSSNGYVIRQLGGHDGSRFQELTFSSDERELVVTDSEGTASLWDVPSGTLRFSQEEAGKLVGWSPDQAQIAFQEEIFNAPLNIFDAESGARLPAEGFPSLQTGREHPLLVYWDGYNPVEVREGNTLLHELEHAGDVKEMIRLPDDRHIVTSDRTGSIYVWDALSGQRVAVNREYSDESVLYPDSLSWGTDGRQLLTDGQLWDVADTRPDNQFHWSHNSLISPDGTRIVERNGVSLEIRDMQTGETLQQLDPGIDRWFAIRIELSWSPSGQFIAASYYDWNDRWNDGKAKVFVWNVQGPSEPVHEFDFYSVSAIAWMPNGNHLTVAGAAAEYQPSWSIWVLDVERGTYIFATELSASTHIFDLDWSADGRLLAVGGPNTLIVWEIDLEREQVSQFWGQYADDIYSGGVVSVAWSPDGRYLATGNRHFDQIASGVSMSGRRPSSVILFDKEQNFGATYLIGHTADVNHVVWSPDGTRLASTGGDKTIRIWRAPFQPDAAAGTTR